jgi:NADH-quinone oxidoreductase subunit M
MNLLLVVLALPLLGFLIALAIPRSMPQASRIWAIVWSLATFVVSIGLVFYFDRTVGGEQLAVDIQWIASPDIHFYIAADGVSLWLVLLSTFLTPICVLISWHSIQTRVKEFFAFLLLLEFGLVGVFIAQDLFLFYVFWELSLVPMYFLIGIWGHDRRIYAAVKFFLYTFAGSVLMLAAIIYLYNKTETFSYPAILDMLSTGRLSFASQEGMLLFLAFFVAFAIKVPLFPLHTWLPDAHVEAPTAGSIMLASVMLKMGTFGILHYCLPMFPVAARQCAPWIGVLAIIGIIYGALVAMVQPNMKKLVAYSSVSHLGFVVLGIFSFTQMGLDGAVYQMLNHGISTGALFAIVGLLYERRHSLEIDDYGGVATVAPWLSTIFLVTTLASIGLPLLNNFVGEFLVLQGTAIANFRWAAYAAIGVILSACYMLWLYQRVFYGETGETVRHHMFDLKPREWAAMIPLVAMMVWMGVYSQSFLPPIGQTTARVLEQTQVNVPFRVQTHPNRTQSNQVHLNQMQPNQTPPGSPTARFGATKKPLADGAPSGPGSDQSHDRKGVIFRNQAQLSQTHPTQALPDQPQLSQSRLTQARPGLAQFTQGQLTQAPPGLAQFTQAQPSQPQPTPAQLTQAPPTQAQPTQAQLTPAQLTPAQSNRAHSNSEVARAR